MCVCIELELLEGDGAPLESVARRLPLTLSIRTTGLPWCRRMSALISATGGCACDMFDGDSSELLPDHRENLASTVEALDSVLAGERALSANWIGDKPSADTSLSAPELASTIREGAFRQGMGYRVRWRGGA